MERLRRILGHATYSMVMRYVHLDKGDLGRDFDQRSHLWATHLCFWGHPMC
jgi:hypothetical protein